MQEKRRWMGQRSIRLGDRPEQSTKVLPSIHFEAGAIHKLPAQSPGVDGGGPTEVSPGQPPRQQVPS
jgi:hypothetical protein